MNVKLLHQLIRPQLFEYIKQLNLPDINISELEDALNINQTQRDYLYNIGAQKFAVGDFTNSLAVFNILVMLEPSNCEYLKSIAANYQVLEEYSFAITYYKLAYVFREDLNADCLYYLANCAYKLYNYEETLKYTRQFIEAEDINKDSDMLLRAKFIQKNAQDKLQMNKEAKS